MKKSDYAVALVLILAIVFGVKYFQPHESELQVLDLPPEPDVPPVTVEAAPPVIRHPIPELPPQVEQTVPEPEPIEPQPQPQPQPQQEATPEEPPEERAEAEPEPEKPLPTLDESDRPIRQDLYTLAARTALDSLLNMNRIVQRFVVTVDNLPRKHLSSSKYRSNQAIRGHLIVDENSQGFYLGEKNFARYEPFVELFESVDSNRLLVLYVHYYPLIQAAYEDLGYPSAYFNDRLIDVIDHLLDTPDIGGRILLVRPHVLYKYADPEQEALSAGRKVFIRMGLRNAARVKSKLRELRQALAGE